MKPNPNQILQDIAKLFDGKLFSTLTETEKNVVRFLSIHNYLSPTGESPPSDIQLRAVKKNKKRKW